MQLQLNDKDYKKCISDDGGTLNLKPCNQGDPSQIWNVGPGGAYQNAKSGKCMGVGRAADQWRFYAVAADCNANAAKPHPRPNALKVGELLHVLQAKTDLSQVRKNIPFCLNYSIKFRSMYPPVVSYLKSAIGSNEKCQWSGSYFRILQ